MIAYKKALIIALAALPASYGADQVFSYTKGNGELQEDMCAWLASGSDKRLNRYCGQHQYASAEVFAKCPEACSALASRPNADPCSDLPSSYTFTGINSGKEYDCAWITKNDNKVADRKFNYCTPEQQLTACA